MQNPEATAHVKEPDDRDNGSLEPKEVVSPLWQPGYLRRFPFLGALAFAALLLCTASSAAVLIGSNGVSQTKWTKQLAPNVVLSGINALANVMLGVAVREGISIAWWRKAMKGATVAQLHTSWEFSESSSGILTNVLSWDAVALAAMATKFAVIDGILFQRATSTYTTQDPPLAVSALGIAATQFPSTGYVVSNNTWGAQTNCGCFMIGDAYTPVVNTWETSNGFFRGYNDWFRAENRSVNHCDGTCYTSIEAIGFEIDCTSEEPVHQNIATAPIAAYQASLSASQNGTQVDDSQWTNIPIFNTSFSLQYPDESNDSATLMLSLYYFQADDPYQPSNSNCSGRVYNTTCTLRPALITYPVKITNFTNPHIVNGVSLVSAPSNLDMMTSTSPPAYNRSIKQVDGFKVGAPLQINDTHKLGGLTALGGFVNALSQFVSSSAALSYGKAGEGTSVWGLNQKGTLAQTMMYGPPNMGSCDCSFRNDSLDTIIESINQLAFLTAIGMVQNNTFVDKTVQTNTSAEIFEVGKNTTITFRRLESTQQISDVIHYRTNFCYMGLALGSTLFCMLLVIPSFWRYGQLGRDVTLGPIEIASAFRAPMLANRRSTMGEASGDLKQVIEEVGNRRVQYGFLENGDSVAAGASNDRQSMLELALEKPEKVRPVSGVWSRPTNPSVVNARSPRVQ